MSPSVIIFPIENIQRKVFIWISLSYVAYVLFPFFEQQNVLWCVDSGEEAPVLLPLVALFPLFPLLSLHNHTFMTNTHLGLRRKPNNFPIVLLVSNLEWSLTDPKIQKIASLLSHSWVSLHLQHPYFSSFVFNVSPHLSSFLLISSPGGHLSPRHLN